MQKTIETLDFTSLSHDAAAELLQQYQINLSVDEALTIQNTLLKRPPTLAECILWSIQGSEHCSYKSSRNHLKQFVTNGPHVILGPKEDAGIVAVATDHEGHRYGVVVSHESHNHPSQIVPYEGAATGVGGNVRDVSCMGAEVIAVADSLRFGDINRSKTHWIHDGVVGGIAGYGNPLGVPNLAGDVYYDAAYNENCLVTVVTLGVVREDHVIHSYAPVNADDYVFILVGKPTDNSGFGGASFASSTLHEDQKERNKGAVQEPNAFLQRHILKANYALFKKLREENLIDKVGFKDLGAGGVACASVELAEAGGYGAEVDLEKVPVSMPDLIPPVILCSETQERFMWVVPPALAEMILQHYNETFALPQVSEGARAAVIGKIRTDGLYVVNYRGQELVRAKASDVTAGILYDRPHTKKSVTLSEPALSEPTDYNIVLLTLLGHENIASRAPVIEMYDKQVQGRTVIEAGRADAGVMQPFNEEKYPEEIRQTGIALSLDQNPRYNIMDAYWGAVNAVVESVRNVVASGASPIALSDCLCFGNPEKPEQMSEFVESVRGIADACRAVTLVDHPSATLPVIAGNVSLYNESANGAIPPSPMISCLGVLPDVAQAVTYDLKRTDTSLIMVGERKDECGGSVYYQLNNELGANLPKPDLEQFGAEVHAVSYLIQQGMVLAAHDISEGGIATALAEMSFRNKIGMRVEIPGTLPLSKKLFGETGGFILEVKREKVNDIKTIFAEHKLECYVIGDTNKSGRIAVNGVIDLPVIDAFAAWEKRITGQTHMTIVDYKTAGVDIAAGNEAVRRIKNAVESTFSPEVLTGIGSFGSMYDLKPLMEQYRHPVLVQSIDGVGTKMMVAKMMQKFDTIGMDLVSATTNDIIVLGAKPLTLLDYIANDKLKPEVVEQIVAGMAAACRENGISLVGGETAEMPGTYLPGEHDLVGVITGVVEKDEAILGKNIAPGDVVVAFPSSGLHTNGYSLARKLFFDIGGYKVDSHLSEFNRTVGEELLSPHINYTRPVLHMLSKKIPIKGMAHITGGGLLENIPRILPKHCAVEIRKSACPVLPVFSKLCQLGQLDDHEAYRTFNMGVGLVMIISPDALSFMRDTLTAFSEFPLYEIGVVTSGEQQVRLV